EEEAQITEENLFTHWAQLYCYDTDMTTVIKDSFVTIDGNTYYFGSTGAAKKGVFEVDGKSYYAYSSGVLAKGIVSRWASKYYYDEDTCEMRTGFITISEDGTDVLYHFNETSGRASNLWFKVDGKSYFAISGVVQRGTVSIWGFEFNFDEETGEYLK
ncbi:MAG: hypothetical protein K6A23_07385, partial [Butyrivibrio sp.]|nr:hypothetical protein [Butyrivibrio sp.]